MLIMLYSCIVWSLQSGSFHQSQACPKILSLAVVPQREDECEAVVPPSSVEPTGCYRQPRSGAVWITVNYMAVALNVYTAITLCCDHSDETSALALHTPAALVFHYRNCAVAASLPRPCAVARCALPLNFWKLWPICGEEILAKTLKSFNQLKRVNVNHSGSLWLTWLTWLMWLYDATWQHWTSHISIYFMHQDLVLPQWDSSRPSIQSGPPRSHEHRSRWYPK